MKNPYDQHRENINFQLFQKFLDSIDFEKLKIEICEHVYKELINKIDNHIRDKNPELLTNFNTLYQNLTIEMKSFQTTIAHIEKKSKKLFESSSLCEDVYSLRDEVKVLKKKMDKFNNAIRKMVD